MEKGSNNSIKFRSNADFAEFVKVTVDGKDLDLKHYTANSGSTVIELNTEYLKTLSVGEHKISIVSTNGHADTIFTIKDSVDGNTNNANDSGERENFDNNLNNGQDNSSSPKTGDMQNVVLWLALFIVSSIITVAIQIEKFGGKQCRSIRYC